MNPTPPVSKQNIIDDFTLKKLYSVQNKTLQKVICYLWLNETNPKQPIDVIDAIELEFNDGSKIALTGNENQEGLTYIEYHFEEQKSMIEKTFEGKIRIFKVEASKTEMWKDTIQQTLKNIRLTKDKASGKYFSDEIILEFENNEKRLIQVHPIDGIILDYYEEI
ncbi:MAG: hypothetical protein N2203_05150 [Bacteroidia bacterium]|nr:hypothetical protein [Bacteroidia bacterium]